MQWSAQLSHHLQIWIRFFGLYILTKSKNNNASNVGCTGKPSMVLNRWR